MRYLPARQRRVAGHPVVSGIRTCVPGRRETPDGTRVEFDTHRVFRLNGVVDDEIGERKVEGPDSAVVAWARIQFWETRRPAAVGAERRRKRPGERVEHRVRSVETVTHRAVGAVTLNPMHFENRREEYSVVIDTALAHLVESEANIRDARDEHGPVTIQELCNTSVIRLQYRTRIKSWWR